MVTFPAKPDARRAGSVHLIAPNANNADELPAINAMTLIPRLLLLAMVTTCALSVQAATFVVDSLLDDTFSGDSNPGDGVCDDDFPTSTDCTLRAAIEEANALPGADRIEFSIAGEIGPDTGNLGPLPVIDDELVIDGTTAPGWSPLQPTLYLVGTAIDAGVSGFSAGLEAAGGALEVFGLGITGFPYAQIQFDNGPAGGRVDGCVLGLDSTGAPEPHPESLSGAGIRLMGDNAVIGRTGPAGDVTGLGNVISGNRLHGIEIRGDGNEVLGNIIGMSRDGLLARGNGAAGILLASFADFSADNNRIGGGSASDGSGNHIANNERVGVAVQGTDNVVDGNNFGFKPGSGVFFNNFTPAITVIGDGHTIGGIGNRIVDHTGFGVTGILLGLSSGDTDLPATNVTVEGNDIGTENSAGPQRGIEVSITNSTGNVIRSNRIANAGVGIRIAANGNVVTENRIGIDADLGPASGPGNMIGIQVWSSDNRIAFNEVGNSTFASGIEVRGSSNDIEFNDIGFAAGLGDVGNARGGVRLTFESNDNLIRGNRILNNGGPGVEFNGNAGFGNTVFGNSIQRNDGIGIDFLEPGNVYGPTENDPGDADFGSNLLMNHPEFGEAVPIPGTNPVEAVVTFLVDSDPANQAFPITVDFYRADEYGGRQGSAFMTAAVFDTFGVAETVTLTLPGGVGIDDHFTALATDADGNTSEFAPARSLGEVIFRDSYED